MRLTCKPSEALRNNIVQVAKKQRYDLKVVAESAGITYRTLSYFLSGERDMTVIVAHKIATFFGLTLVGLIQWKDK